MALLIAAEDVAACNHLVITARDEAQRARRDADREICRLLAEQQEETARLRHYREGGNLSHRAPASRTWRGGARDEGVRTAIAALVREVEAMLEDD